MTVRGKPGKPKARFPLFPPPLEIAVRFPHSTPLRRLETYIKERAKSPSLGINNLGWAQLNRRNGPDTLAKRTPPVNPSLRRGMGPAPSPRPPTPLLRAGKSTRVIVCSGERIRGEGHNNYKQQIGGIQGGSAGAKTFLLLHELAHVLGLFKSDSGSDSAQKQNNDL